MACHIDSTLCHVVIPNHGLHYFIYHKHIGWILAYNGWHKIFLKDSSYGFRSLTGKFAHGICFTISAKTFIGIDLNDYRFCIPEETITPGQFVRMRKRNTGFDYFYGCYSHISYSITFLICLKSLLVYKTGKSRKEHGKGFPECGQKNCRN